MRVFPGISLAAFLAVGCAASPLYTVTDLGALGGSSTTGFALNAGGQAVGWGVDALGNTQALIFGAGGPVAAWLNGQASGINASGQVSGTAWMAGTAHGVVWSNGALVDLGANTSAATINDSGQVAASGAHALLWQNGSTTDLGTLAGGNWSLAEGLNAAGTVAGYGDTAAGIRGFVWTPGTGMEQLGTLGGGSSYAMSVDDNGVVGGSAAAASGYLHAVVWHDGIPTDLGTLGGNASYGYGINDQGVMVGYSWLAGNAITHAFIAIDGVMVDLNSLLPPQDRGWVITAAYGVNDQGQIVGEATFNGESHAVLLNDPPGAPGGGPLASNVPEPATWILAGGALVAVALGRFIRWR